MSEGFLSRWARRKVAVRAAERAEGKVPSPEAKAPDCAPALGRDAPATEAGIDEPEASVGGHPEQEPDALLADLPSLDTLTSGTDLAPFLRAGVPSALRNAALRRMWSLDPAIRDFVSEAREYAYDWNSPGGVPGLGPLLPTDDVAAMLRRLVGSVPEQPSGSGSIEASSREMVREAQQEPAPEAEAASASAADCAGKAAAMPGGAEPGVVHLLSEAAPTASAAHVRPGLPLDARSSPVPELVPPVQAPERPRLRRHGGAMPA